MNICKNPEIVRDGIDIKIVQLQKETGTMEHEAEQLQRELDRLAEERQWVITIARKGRISEDDMDGQLAAIDLQAIELRKKRDDKLSALVVQQQAEGLKDCANQYLTNLAIGLRVLETDIMELNEMERANLYDVLGANRFEEKYNGDRLAALRWAILEEKRRTVRMLISKILLVKDKDGTKRIIPKLTFEIPQELASLVYGYQSLAYVEQAKELIEGA